MPPALLRPRRLLGKYRIERRLARGGFADVFQAFDTIEGTRVVLKIPHANLVDKDVLELFKREVRLTAKLDHPNILGIKTADFIEGHFVIVSSLGLCDLSERLKKRVSIKNAMDLGEQLLEALAYAHERRIVHCDVKPENLILFDGGRLRLTDFGIAKVSLRTLRAEGTGTLGFVSPEQAMGRPSLRSDVFSAGLVLWRLFAGKLPEWPFAWPFPGHERLNKVHPELAALLRRSLELDPGARFADATRMLEAFQRVKRRALVQDAQRASKRRGGPRNGEAKNWQSVRLRQFRRAYGRSLMAKHDCAGCGGPVSEAMRHCPWCSRPRKQHPGEIDMPAQCSRCKRGVKLDWHYCPWCYGGKVGPLSEREYSDKRYSASCSRSGCGRKDLMPWMRYCPWCNAKVTRRWSIEPAPKGTNGSGHTGRCGRCGWGVLRGYWDACAWCGVSLK